MKLNVRLVVVHLAVIASLATFPAAAHEFWLDPVDFMPKAGDEVPVLHRTGINFLGDSYPYLREMAERFTVIDARGERPIKAVDGDDPAADVSLPNAGLAIVAYQRAADTLVHPTIERFTEIVTIEGLAAIASQHRAAGLPSTDIRETYARFAKSLLKVGNVSGPDRAVGLPFEIVFDGDPYQLPHGAPIRVHVLQAGKPVSNVLVKAFNLSDPMSPRTCRTTAEGYAELQGVPSGEVLVSAVTMQRADQRSGAHWSSSWASLTFRRP